MAKKKQWWKVEFLQHKEKGPTPYHYWELSVVHVDNASIGEMGDPDEDDIKFVLFEQDCCGEAPREAIKELLMVAADALCDKLNKEYPGPLPIEFVTDAQLQKIRKRVAKRVTSKGR